MTIRKMKKFEGRSIGCSKKLISLTIVWFVLQPELILITDRYKLKMSGYRFFDIFLVFMLEEQKQYERLK